MRVKYYDAEKSRGNKLNDIEGHFRNFDQTKDKISDFKFMFILPNGEYLLVPYTERDLSGDVTYNHIDYLPEALELILEKLNINRDDFIKNKVEDFNTAWLEYAILNLNIAIFYDFRFYKEGKLTFFEKPIRLTEKQKKSIAALKKPLENENYRFGIRVLEDDRSIKENESIVRDDPSFHMQFVYMKDKNKIIDVNTLFDIINLDIEQTR